MLKYQYSDNPKENMFTAFSSMPDCLPDCDENPVFDLLSDAVQYVVDEIDLAVDQAVEAGYSQDWIAEWEDALAHAQSYRDGSRDLPFVTCPDRTIWQVVIVPVLAAV